MDSDIIGADQINAAVDGVRDSLHLIQSDALRDFLVDEVEGIRTELLRINVQTDALGDIPASDVRAEGAAFIIIQSNLVAVKDRLKTLNKVITVFA